MDLLLDPQIWLAFITLAAIEVVLGVDNIIFLTILTGRLPEAQRARARMIGLSLALGFRLVLIFSITWIMGLTKELFAVAGHGFSGRDLILLGGGLFLIWKATKEIHNALEGPDDAGGGGRVAAGFVGVVAQIAVLDMVFSFDSVITAVGMVQHVEVMVAAVLVSVLLMMVAAQPIGDFIEQRPTIKMLALSFLVMIGFTLIAESGEVHVPKGYIYFAMAFSVLVEMLNMRVRARQPVQLHQHIPGDEG